MKNLRKLFVLGFSVMFGFAVAACNHDKPSDSNSNTSVSNSSVASTTDSTSSTDSSTASDSTSSTVSSTDSSVSTDSSSETPHGHDWTITWNWDASADSATATATIVCETDATHTETVTAVVTEDRTAAGCETAGSVTYTATAAFVDYADADVVLTDTKTVTVPATGHVHLTNHAAVAAGCETAGNVEYWTCEDCSKYFLDSAATNETDADGVVTSATGHDWTISWNWDASADNATATATIVCGHDGTHTETVTAVVTEDRTAATCEAAGSVTYTATAAFVNYTNVNVKLTDTKTVTVPATGHVHLTHHAAVAATCEAAGNVEYWTCDDCNKVFRDSDGLDEITIDETVVPATDHFVTTYDTVVSAHIAGNATISGICTYCNERITKDVAAPASAPIPMSFAGLDSYFTIENGSYYFVYDEATDSLTSNNHGQRSSDAVLALTALVDIDFSFDYVVNSESNWDFLKVQMVGQSTYLVSTKVSGKDGEDVTGTASVSLKAGEGVRILYSKDSSGDKGRDEATISNFVVKVAGLDASAYEGMEFDYAIVNMVSTSAHGDTEYDQVVVLAGTTVGDLTELDKDGTVFRGWFSDDNYATAVPSTTVIDDTMTIYVKMAKAITVTVHANNGTEDVVTKIAAGDTFATPENPKLEGSVFAGWYTTPDFAPDSVYSTRALEESIDLYAKYMDAPWYLGTFKTAEVWGTSNGRGSAGSKADTTIDDDLLVKMGSSNIGTINPSSFDANGKGYVTTSSGGHTAMWMNEAKGIIVYNYSSGKDVLTNDIYIAAMADSLSVSTGKNAGWASGNKRLITLTINGLDEIIYADVTKDRVYFDVTVTDFAGNPMTVEEVYAGNKFVSELVILSSGTEIARMKYVGSDYVELDGVQGTYNGAFGLLELDGAGTAIIAGNTEMPLAYKIVGDHIEVTINNRTRAFALGVGTYDVVNDGSQGTYTGDYGTFVSNGDGSCTLDGVNGIYAKDDKTLTITINGETKMVVLKDDGTYATDSIFAGHTFKGTFTMQGDTEQLYVVFNSGAEITGTIYMACTPSSWQQYYVTFTATFENGVLTMTVTGHQYIPGAVGKVYTATVSGNSMTFDKSIEQYSIAGATVTSDTFTL